MKIAFVYDRVNKFGGAERVLLTLHEIWPEAPLYTAVYNKETAQWARKFSIIPSFLQKFPLAKSTHEVYPWLTPLSFESFNFEDYDVVISITSAEAKAIITKPKTMHVCYCLTPTRYLWSHENDYLENPGFGVLNPIARIISRPIFHFLKKWDKITSFRPDYYLAISKNVANRIKKYYGRESEMVYPPVEINKFQIPSPKSQMVRQAHHPERSRGTNSKLPPAKAWHWRAGKIQKYFLVVSRLVAYKKVDLVIRAFNELKWSLKVVGVGREMGRLKKMAKPNIQFLGELTDEELLSYYQNCQALIFPQEEDFGIVSLEAQAAGRPVIAFKSGGALETIIEGVTGEFFYPHDASALYKKLKYFSADNYLEDNCRKNAERFSKKRFIKEFKNKVENNLKEYQRIITT